MKSGEYCSLCRKQYYLYPMKNTNVHPQASMQWFEKAKAVKKSDWMKGAKRIGGQGQA